MKCIETMNGETMDSWTYLPKLQNGRRNTLRRTASKTREIESWENQLASFCY